MTLHIRITLLSDVFATAGYAHGRAAIGLLQTLMNNTSPEVVTDLGALHRASIWENIVFNIGLNAKGIDVQATPATSPLEQSPARETAPETDGAVTANGASDVNGFQQHDDAYFEALMRKPPPKHEGPRDKNAAALKHLTHGLPSSLAPFFQGGGPRVSSMPFFSPLMTKCTSNGEDVPCQT